MRQRLFFSFLILHMLWPWAPALSQIPDSTQLADLNSKSQLRKSIETDERAWLAKAQQGDRHAQFWLGCAYEQGWLGKPNFLEALKWFRRSAELGGAYAQNAQNELGEMYENGEGVAQSDSSAAKWYRKAAEHFPDFGGAGSGRNNLGLLYLNGEGAPKDYVKAYMWFKLAGDANPNLPYTKDHMTPKQILKAERLVAEWKRGHAVPQ
jgi:uncharacterized protein